MSPGLDRLRSALADRYRLSPDDQRFIMVRIRVPPTLGPASFKLVENWFEITFTTASYVR